MELSGQMEQCKMQQSKCHDNQNDMHDDTIKQHTKSCDARQTSEKTNNVK